MMDYELVEKYKSYNFFIGDVIDPTEMKKHQEGIKRYQIRIILYFPIYKAFKHKSCYITCRLRSKWE